MNNPLPSSITPLLKQVSSPLSRIDKQELLDQNIGTLLDVRTNFADLWRINRYLGGLQALTQHLYPRLMKSGQPVRLMDVGTGSADLLVWITRWAHRQQIDLDCCGVDFSARNLSVAHPATANNIRLIQADALHLPFQRNTFDYIISCLFLHHLAPAQVKLFLSKAFDSARCGIVMTDLVRGRLPLLAFKLVQPVFARNFLTRQDGITSINRSYTPSELRELAVDAGLSNVRIYEHFPWRMTLVADK